MDRFQNAQLTKDKLLLLVFLKFKLIIDAIPKLMGYVAAFKVRVLKADGYKDVQVRDISGHAEQKKNSKEESVSGALVISGFIYALAYDENDLVLQHEMDVVKTTFEKKGETSLSLLKNILTTATTRELELADYGMTAPMLAEYAANVNAFDLEINLPKSAIDHRHFETEELAKELNAADAIIANNIERLMRHFKKTNPEFFSEFSSANKDVILGSHQTRNPTIPMGNFKLVIRDKDTLDLIAEALVKIDYDEEVYIYKSSKVNIIEEPIGGINGTIMSANHKPTNFTGVVTDVAQTIEVLMEPLD